jgi:hypothetical protein
MRNIRAIARPAAIAAVLILVLVLAGMAAAQVAPGGDIIAGQPSPWKSAHYVIAAYGAILAGLVLYLWRLSGLARRIDSDLREAERTLDGDRSRGR